jgi:hypothetical protein
MKGHKSYVDSERVYDKGTNIPPVGSNSVVKDETWAAGESERVYDGGVNMPPVGANSVVKDETWAVANRQLLPGHERVYDNGVNTPPVGANSVVKDETWAAANRQLLPGHERVQMEYGERGLTKGEGEAVNEFIRAKAYDGATHIYVIKQGAGNGGGGNNTKPTNSTITFNGTVRIEGGNTSKDYDINDLVNNREFIRSLFSRPEVTDAIMYAVNTNYFMKPNNDPSSMAGGWSTNLGGKLTNL